MHKLHLIVRKYKTKPNQEASEKRLDYSNMSRLRTPRKHSKQIQADNRSSCDPEWGPAVRAGGRSPESQLSGNLSEVLGQRVHRNALTHSYVPASPKTFQDKE